MKTNIFQHHMLIKPVNHMLGWSAQECWEHLFFSQKSKFTSKTKREYKIVGTEHEKALRFF